MAQPGLDRALVEMLAMGLPDALAAQEPAQKRERGVGEVIKGKDQRRHPEAVARQREQQPAEKIAQGNAAHIAHENARRMPVPPEESQRRAGGGEPVKGERVPGGHSSGDGSDADTQGYRLAAGESVDAVHEIEQIEEPQPEEAGGKAVEGDG